RHWPAGVRDERRPRAPARSHGGSQGRGRRDRRALGRPVRPRRPKRGADLVDDVDGGGDQGRDERRRLMASVFYRGSKSAPRWFARFRDPTGSWRSKRVRVQTRKDALAIARQLEAQSERRRYGTEAPESAGLLLGELMKRWE